MYFSDRDSVLVPAVMKLNWLSQIESVDRPWVGDKAWMLSQLQQKGYPILPGFVVSSLAWGEFLEKLNDSTSLLADFPASSLHVDVDNFQALQSVAQQSRQIITDTPFSEAWRANLGEAVEQLSSASLILHSSLGLPLQNQPGLSDLLLPQRCSNSPQALEKAIKQIWRQLFSAKSLFYSQRIGIGIEQLTVGVLVQPLTKAIASGIVTVFPDTFEIQATWGLPQSLWQGEVLGDRFVLDRITGEVKEQQLGHKIRAYRLKEPNSDPLISDNPIDSYVLSPTQQEQYCLDASILNQLFELLQQLGQEALTWESLEWSLIESQKQFPPLVITHITSGFSVASTPPPLSSEPPITSDRLPLLTGIAASPGRVYGLTRVMTGETDPNLSFSKNNVIVTKELHPSQLPWLKQVGGIITEQGGLASHAAILARELEIPAVVGVSGATELLRTGDSILLDGQTGKIYRYSEENKDFYAHIPLNPQKLSSSLTYPIATQLMVNVSQPNSLVKAMDLPIDGIGLLRSELMLLSLSSPLSLEQWLRDSEPVQIVEQIRQCLQEFTTRFAPRPVFYRSFDSQTCQSIHTTIQEDHRGTAGYLFNPTVFDWELKALAQVQQQGFHNLRLVLPFVRSVAEFQFCRHRVEQAGLMKSDGFELWIMAEVPSVIFELEDYVKAGVQGIAIGTNDLVPLLLGVGRNHRDLSDLTKPCPAALKIALKQLIEQSRQFGIPCCLCGQVAVQHPDLIDDLVRWGITTISVETEAIEQTYQAIARAEQRIILELARQPKI